MPTLELDLWQEVPFYDNPKEDASPRAWDTSVSSYWNSHFVEVIKDASWNFRWPRNWVYKNLPHDIRNVAWMDGIGTATVIADALLKYNTDAVRLIAQNFVAMVADDRIQNGDLPLVILNDISVRNHHQAGYNALMQWLNEVLKKQELVMIWGETATLWECVGSPNPDSQFAFNMSWVAIWVNHPKMQVLWDKIRAWDYIVALEQWGFWSNGLTMARKALTLKYYETAPKEILETVITPCVVYSRAVAEALWWYNNDLIKALDKWEKPWLDIHAIAHLSGGGIFEKFWKAFLTKKWLSADISDPFPIPEIALKLYTCLQEAGQAMTPQEFYKTWCNGQRMLVVVPTQDEAEKLIKILTKFNVNSKIAWRVTETPKGKNSTIILPNQIG